MEWVYQLYRIYNYRAYRSRISDLIESSVSEILLSVALHTRSKLTNDAARHAKQNNNCQCQIIYTNILLRTFAFSKKSLEGSIVWYSIWIGGIFHNTFNTYTQNDFPNLQQMVCWIMLYLCVVNSIAYKS